MSRLVDLCRFLQYGDLPTSYYVKQGLKVGKNFCRQSGTKMDLSHCWLISIGDDVTLSNKVQILAHDDSIRVYTGYGRIGRVSIGNRVFVGANTTILMNTHIGDDVVIAAGSIITKDIPSNSVVAGVPARIIGKTTDYVEREKSRMNSLPTFDIKYAYGHENNEKQKEEMVEKLRETYGFQQLGLFHED